jgi:hypothetical protein
MTSAAQKAKKKTKKKTNALQIFEVEKTVSNDTATLGCQIFLDTMYQNEGKIPNYHSITKWPYN